MSNVNLLVTPTCNNNCQFCFAKDWIFENLKSDPLSRKQIEELISFFKKSKNPGEIGIMGGEPFTYKDLRYLIDELMSNNISNNFAIFSGGIFNPKVIETIDGLQDNLHISVNLKEKESYPTEKQHTTVINNIETLIRTGFSTGISYNIDSINFNGDEITNFALDHGIKDLRIAIANPIHRSKSASTVAPELYDTLSKNVFDFLTESAKKGVSVGIDCKIPLCFFSDEQLGKLSKKQPLAVRAVGSCACGKGPIDIDHKLSVSKCFPFWKVSKPISEFDSLEDARERLYQNVDSKFNKPSIKPECKECEYNTQCSGGCLASNQNDFLSNETENERLDDLFNILKESYNKFDSDRDNWNRDYFEGEISNLISNIREHPIIYYRLTAYYDLIGEPDKANKAFMRFTRLNQGYIPHEQAKKFSGV